MTTTALEHVVSVAVGPVLPHEGAGLVPLMQAAIQHHTSDDAVCESVSWDQKNGRLVVDILQKGVTLPKGATLETYVNLVEKPVVEIVSRALRDLPNTDGLSVTAIRAALRVPASQIERLPRRPRSGPRIPAWFRIIVEVQGLPAGSLDEVTRHVQAYLQARRDLRAPRVFQVPERTAVAVAFEMEGVEENTIGDEALILVEDAVSLVANEIEFTMRFTELSPVGATH